ncbi:DoxX family membrane protein [Streptomyces sp. N2-109]|uniref:DoxX family membrane protein n=1 Tax=Streptomyces gossypii TaxID=2883101 RepID=A0ABT2JL80_9ACTN|nr:DoxX family membrane protein [Streptomyces gossypii]MCT2588476.1 DoxX family membrane protein [Streptomyces gossypii]
MRVKSRAAATGLDTDQNRQIILGLFRIVVGLLFACRGAATLFDVLGGPNGGVVPGFAAWPGWWAAAIQLVGGTLVLLGLGTRSAAVICSGSMAYAYFTEHQAQAVFPLENSGEAAAMFCWAFLIVAAFDHGRLALDTLCTRYRASRTSETSEPRRTVHAE